MLGQDKREADLVADLAVSARDEMMASFKAMSKKGLKIMKELLGSSGDDKKGDGDGSDDDDDGDYDDDSD